MATISEVHCSILYNGSTSNKSVIAQSIFTKYATTLHQLGNTGCSTPPIEDGEVYTDT